MYIHEAVTAAMEQDCFIHNTKNAFNDYIYMKPTNDPEGIIGYDKQNKQAPCLRWQPKAEDLSSDGWELYHPGN